MIKPRIFAVELPFATIGIRLVEAEEALRRDVPRAVDETVEPSEARVRRIDRGTNLREVGDVRLQE